ncbi:MAG: hypothetical protein JWN71_4068 [Xanthobacteraceae bacterium]|nr:hypothetical protein [Xanthobacteraceae bacterium]
MTRTTLCFLIICSAIACLFGSPAYAQATRTWVSGVGDDANPCSRTAPCKTFAGAISKTAAGGEISVLDPGGFGAVTVTKSISIVSDYSGEAGILASGTNGVTINAAATDVVTLRGLTIDGAGTGLIGINYIQAGAVHVQNSVIKNFRSGSAMGIRLAPNAGTAGELYVDNTVIQDCGNSAANGGVVIAPNTTGSARAIFNFARLENNSSGLIANQVGVTGKIFVAFNESTAGGSPNAGVTVITQAGSGGTNLTLNRSASVHNATGAVSDGPLSFIIISNSIFIGNSTGISAINSGQILSPGNNLFGSLVADGTPTGPATLK